MGYKTTLCRLVVIRGNNQKTVCAQFLRLLRQFNRILRIVATSSGNHRDPVVGMLYCKSDTLPMFLVIQRGGLTGCAANDNGICAVFNLKINVLAQSCIIYRTVFQHRRNNGYACTCKNGVFHSNYLLMVIQINCVSNKLSPYSPLLRAVLPREHRRRLHHAGYCGTGRQTYSQT